MNEFFEEIEIFFRCLFALFAVVFGFTFMLLFLTCGAFFISAAWGLLCFIGLYIGNKLLQ